jgi:ankyrin repeat protein
MVLQNEPLGGPQLALSTTRLVAPHGDIFLHTMQGNIEGLQDLFSRGRASPYDMTCNYGWTALHYAVAYKQLDVCEFLIKAAGARPSLMDFERQSPGDLAYRQIHFENIDESSSDRLKTLFDEDEWLEQKQFTVFHKVVLNLLEHQHTLEDQLKLSAKDIHQRDSDGRDPLSWAAERGDIHALTTLLQYGGRVNDKDHDGNRPLHYAAKASEPNALQLLLANGANPSAVNHRGQTALDWVSFFQDDPIYLEAMLAYPDVDVNCASNLDITPACNAAFRGHARMLIALIAAGANINHRPKGNTGLLYDCISLNDHRVLRVLIDHAQACELNISMLLNDARDTCLHVLARHADLETARIFLIALREGTLNCAGLSTNNVNKDGLTPGEILASRLGNKPDVGEKGEDDGLAAIVVVRDILDLVDLENLERTSQWSITESATSSQYHDTFELLPQVEDGNLKDFAISIACEEILVI